MENKQDLKSIDWFEVVSYIEAQATSELAKTDIRNLTSLNSANEARKSFFDIASAQLVLAATPRPFMQSLDMMFTWLHRLQKSAVLKIMELKDIRLFCLEAIALTEALKMGPSDWAEQQLNQLMNAEEPLSAIDQIITPSGEIRSDASQKLYQLFNEKERLAREVQNILDKLVKSHQLESMLQDRYVTTRQGRWVLPIRSGMQHFVAGKIQGSSQTKQTVFIEPEKTNKLNDRLSEIEVEIEEEIERLMVELSRYLHSKVNEFVMSQSVLKTCDICFAKALFAQHVGANPIDFQEDEIQLMDVEHPLLKLSQKQVIANQVQLGQNKRILLLSGPNAGGKTVLLKSIGLTAHMARCGLFVCAGSTSRLPFFKNILVSIGDAQSVSEELSTFAAHLKKLQNAASLKTSDALVLVDEICGSTDPEEGSSLARSFIERMDKNGIFAVVTSHLGPLKSGWPDESHVLSGSMEYDEKTGKPTYQFLPGVPGESLAIATAERVGIDLDIVIRAKELLSPTTRARLEGLSEIENLKKNLSLLQKQVSEEFKKAESEKLKYHKLLQELKAEKEDLLRKEVKKAQQKVDQALAHVKVESVFQKHRQLSEIKQQLPQIIKATPIAGWPQSLDDFKKRCPPGSKVHVSSLQQDAVVQSEPNNKGEVWVLAQSLRLQIHWSELKAPHKPTNPTAQLVRQSSTFTVSLKDEDRVVDLRGQFVEQAIENLEVQLDQAVRNHESRLKIIHGHGTEALKKAVRVYLSRSVHVKKWKAGTPETGGDGLTWAELEV